MPIMLHSPTFRVPAKNFLLLARRRGRGLLDANKGMRFIPRTPARIARWLLLLIVPPLIVGCGTTARFEPYKQTSAVIGNGEQVVILARRNHSDYEAEPGLVNCISEDLAKGRDGLAVHPTRDFVNQLYPWFEPATAPLSTDDLASLLQKPRITQAMEKTRVRFLVWLDGSTSRVSSGGGISCAAGIGGAGCMGLAWWEDDARYDATVWDLDALSDPVGTIHADVKGRSIMPALVIPIPLVARPEAKACHGLSDQLRKFLTTPKGYAPGPEPS